MCSVVVRWSSGQPTEILALRDELVGRTFDDPGRWWPELPTVIGGRDRAAGGTWCASRIDTGATALVLNRPPRPQADPGAPSRGVLPLAALVHGADWPAHVGLVGMASFALVLAAPDGMTVWTFDGHELSVTDHPEGTHMVTSGGPEDRKADRYLAGLAAADHPDGWRRLVESRTPADDPGALVVRHEREGLVFATVFGQLIQTQPGQVRLEFSREPWRPGTWSSLSVPE